MATTISIEDLGNGKYKITDSDQQTRVVGNSIAIQEAGKSGVKIQKAGNTASLPGGSNPKDSTGFTNNAAGQNYPEGTPTVIVNGKPLSVTDAINQARSAKNLGLIRKNLLDSQQLTKAEAKDPNNLLDKWSQIVYGASQDPDPANKDPFKYAQSLQAQGFASTTGQQTYEPYGQQVLWDENKAQAFVNQQYQQNLHRLPTPAELSKNTADLLKQQQKASSISKTTYKIINGVRTQVSTTGFDEQAWLDKRLQKTPEYQTIQSQLSNTALADLRTVALANGLNLDANFGSQVNDWVNRLKTGESIDVFKNIIRSAARNTLPQAVRDSIDPSLDLSSALGIYVNDYAKTFGIPATQVDINKIIPLAITDKGFAPISDFQKKKRSLNEWQYTPEAKTEVADVATTVLKDFGFMG